MTTPEAARAETTFAQRAWAAEALDLHWDPPDGTEDLHAGGTHILDLVAAVDHLARGLRHDFTVWDALDEALHRWLNDQAWSCPAPARHNAGPEGAQKERDSRRSRDVPGRGSVAIREWRP